jgi:hypothetical protein
VASLSWVEKFGKATNGVVRECRRAAERGRQAADVAAPVLRGALRGVRRVAMETLSSMEEAPITTHVALAGAVTAGASLIAAFSDPATAHCVKCCGAVLVSCVAVSAALCVARRYGHPAHSANLSALLRATTRHVALRHDAVPAAKALSLLHAPIDLVALLANLTVDRVVGAAIRHVAGAAMETAVPYLGVALDVGRGYHAVLRTAAFVRDFEATAEALCADVAVAKAAA